MHPEIFHIGPITIRAYGLMLAISFFLGLLYVQRIAKRENRAFETFIAVSYIMIGGGILGARLFYVLFHLEEFSTNWTASFNPFASDEFGIAGLNMYGGVLVAITGTYIYCRIKRISTLDLFDYISPTLGLGIAITRIGCFLNGCCFGTPTDLPWGVSFPEGSIPYWVFQNTPLHPAQLYSSLYGVILFVLLHFVLKKRRFVGQPVAFLFMAEAAFRFAIEYVRYYEHAMHFSLAGIDATYNQLISVGLFLLGSGIYLVQARNRAARLR